MYEGRFLLPLTHQGVDVSFFLSASVACNNKLQLVIPQISKLLLDTSVKFRLS